MSSIQKSSNKFLIPITLVMGYVPLIVHMYRYNTGYSRFEWFPDSDEAQVDFFWAWKMITLTLAGIVMLGILLYQYRKNEKCLRFENSLYVLSGYGMFVVMSALFSPYKYWVVSGAYELFESVWVVLSYMVMCFYTYTFVKEEKQAYTLLGWSGIGIALVVLIGAFQG